MSHQSSTRRLISLLACAGLAALTAAAPASAHHLSRSGSASTEFGPSTGTTLTAPVSKVLSACLIDPAVTLCTPGDQTVTIPPAGGVLTLHWTGTDGRDLVGPTVTPCGSDNLGRRITMEDGKGTLTVSASFTPRDPLSGELNSTGTVTTEERTLSGRDLDINAGLC